MAKSLYGRRQLCAEHRQQNCRGVFGVVIDDLVGNAQPRPGSQWFATAGIADKARVSAARDLEAHALSLSEAEGGWPDLDRDMQAAIGFREHAPRGQTQNAITQVDGLARCFHDAEPGEEVGMVQA